MKSDDATKFEEVIVALRDKRPFDPFRIVTAKGVKLLVANPDQLMVAPHGTIRLVERTGRLNTLHRGDVVAIEELKVKFTARSDFANKALG